ACFLSMRSIEQIKVDVAYSNKNVKLVGISGGVSYGALGMSHHSLQDIAVARAIPNLQVLLPADRFETIQMFKALAASNEPAYIRLGRN
ncbi:transketolase family protein, partial [Enterococcus faecalis]